MKKIETSNSAILEAIAEYTICNADMEIEIADIEAVEAILATMPAAENDYIIY
jgi:hypothetical protein